MWDCLCERYFNKMKESSHKLNHLINMFFKLKEGSRTRGHKAALVKEQCRLDMRKYSFSQRMINEWNTCSNDYVNTSRVNMFKHILDRYLIRLSYT